MTAQRYDLVTNYRWGGSIEEMERSDDGEWVRYEDVQQELEQLRQWRSDVTAALLNPGGSFYADVPAQVRAMREALERAGYMRVTRAGGPHGLEHAWELVPEALSVEQWRERGLEVNTAWRHRLFEQQAGASSSVTVLASVDELRQAIRGGR